jgi:hypothetical protein
LLREKRKKFFEPERENPETFYECVDDSECTDDDPADSGTGVCGIVSEGT